MWSDVRAMRTPRGVREPRPMEKTLGRRARVLAPGRASTRGLPEDVGDVGIGFGRRAPVQSASLGRSTARAQAGPGLW